MEDMEKRLQSIVANALSVFEENLTKSRELSALGLDKLYPAFYFTIKQLDEYYRSEISLALAQQKESLREKVERIELKQFDEKIKPEVVDFAEHFVEETKKAVLSLLK